MKVALDWSEFPCGKNPGSKPNVEEEFTGVTRVKTKSLQE